MHIKTSSLSAVMDPKLTHTHVGTCGQAPRTLMEVFPQLWGFLAAHSAESFISSLHTKALL